MTTFPGKIADLEDWDVEKLIEFRGEPDELIKSKAPELKARIAEMQGTLKAISGQ